MITQYWKRGKNLPVNKRERERDVHAPQLPHIYMTRVVMNIEMNEISMRVKLKLVIKQGLKTDSFVRDTLFLQHKYVKPIIMIFMKHDIKMSNVVLFESFGLFAILTKSLVVPPA